MVRHWSEHNGEWRPIRLFITAGPLSAMRASPSRQRVSDDIGARPLCGSLPTVEWLIADLGYDADWFREAFQDKGIRPCTPGRTPRGKAVRYDKRRYKRRNRPSQRMHAFACRATIEIRFGRLKDWHRIATRYDRRPKVFLSATALATAALFWL